jgi:hypothetical protein
MICSIKKKTGHPLSFISSLAGYINKLSETLESQHKSLDRTKALKTKATAKLIAQITKDSESILLFRQQLHKWKQTAHSNFQQQQIATLEEKLSKATKLNAELYKLVATNDGTITLPYYKKSVQKQL